MKTFQVNLVQTVDKKMKTFFYICCYKKLLYTVSMTYKRNVPLVEP